MNFIKFNRKLHKWSGITLGVFLLVSAVTGFLLIHKERFQLGDVKINDIFLTEKYKQESKEWIKKVQAISRIERESPQSLLVGTKNGLYHYQGQEKRWTDITYDLEDPDIKGMVVIGKRCLLATKSGLFLTEDLGKNYTKVLNEPDLCVGTGQGIAVSPGNPHIVYVSSHKRGIFRSSDGGRRWMNVSGKLPQDPRTLDSGGEFHVHGLAISPEDPNTLFVGTASGLFQTRNAGKSWQEIGVNQAYVTCVTIDPSNPQVIYAGTKSHHKDLRDGVYRSNDGGNSWEDISTGITKSGKDTVIQSIQVNPTHSNMAVLGTKHGLYQTENSGENWKNLMIRSAHNKYTQSVNTAIFDKEREGIIYIGASTGVFQYDLLKLGLIDFNIGSIQEKVQRGHNVSLEEIIKDIHDGQFFGGKLWFLYDLLSLALVLFVLTGITLWWYPRWSKSKKRDLPNN
ncbi:MAG: hypothetical protein HYY20_09365 [Candidatus Tectomicrobia bacterium]|uniref:Sortilin N-terminal domain-containing protein n=1 Tax=Tectimicrobiota bacterium TaxID=2528274 RepID=A0A932CPD8_UNCTE|nr:hypothetical protein [Candidatus Tectomicrobia bacterium]